MLLEQIAGGIDEELVNATVQKILSECGEFIRAVGDTPLYRGMDQDPRKIHDMKQRGSRGPQDSSDELHDMLDAALAPIAGFKPRSNAVFATGEQDLAAGYGNEFTIYPRDGYRFIWSTLIGDAFGFFEMGARTAEGEAMMKKIKAMIPDYDAKMRNASPIEHAEHNTEVNQLFLDKYAEEIYKTGENSTLLEAIESGNEIMINCQSFIAVPVDTRLGGAVRAALKARLK